MQPSGEVGRFEVEDQPSPPADRNRYPTEMPAATLHQLVTLSTFTRTYSRLPYAGHDQHAYT